MKKQFQKLRRFLWPFLPLETRLKLIRNNVTFFDTPPKGVIFKLARTQDELTQAFKLLHDNYVASGYMDPHPSGMRLTKYHALPSTSTLIAIENGKVLATVSLIRSSAFGLPCETAYDIDFLKTKGDRIVEVSALSVHPSVAKKNGYILWPLLKFAHHYSVEYFGTDCMVIVVNPDWFDFYQATWFFEPFTGKKIEYGYVKGAKSVGGYMKHRHRQTKAELTYSSMPTEKNYYRYIYELTFDCFQFPERKFWSVSDPVMTPENLDYFFNQQSNVLNELSEIEKITLHELYNSKKFSSILPLIENSSALPLQRRRQQNEKRFDVECDAQISLDDKTAVSVQIKNVSLSGIGTVMKREIRFAETYKIQVNVGWGKSLELNVEPTWRQQDGVCGFSISGFSKDWENFIQDLDSDLLQLKKVS